MAAKPTLFIMSGLPGTGKSSLAKRLAQQYGAAYLRIDTVEQALRDLCDLTVQGEGYWLVYRVAADNLQIGRSVVADSCNPIALTRQEWQAVAQQNGAVAVNIEVLCSDRAEHKRRVETRENEVAGLRLPTWDEVEQRVYQPWHSQRIVVDTARQTLDESFAELMAKVSREKGCGLGPGGS